MIKKIISVSMLMAFIAAFIFLNEYFQDQRRANLDRAENFNQLTKSLFISPLSTEDLRSLCHCEITPIENAFISFTIRDSSDIEPVRNRTQLAAYEEAQSKTSLTICGLVNASVEHSKKRSSQSTTTYSGVPFTSPKCNSLWHEGRAFFKP